MTQHQKILQLHENREWICQAEYRNISWCPHKRRKDIEEGRAKGIPAGKYHFESKDCEHGIKGSRDYLLIHTLTEESIVNETRITGSHILAEPFIEQAEKLNL